MSKPKISNFSRYIYACYRTKDRGWQLAGYIVVRQAGDSIANLPTEKDDPDLWADTAWVEDTEGKYKIGHIYPELVTSESSKK